MTADSGSPYLFLSYATPDRERAMSVAAALEDAGLRVWVDRTDISAGSGWAEEIVAAISRCHVFVILCSPSSVRSRNVRQELHLAWDNERPIVPVILDPVELPGGMSYFLQGWQWIDATGRTEASWTEELVAACVRLGTPVTPRTSERELQETGSFPRTFGPLLGREREIENLVGRLRGGSRLVTLTGPGGVGKTRLAVEAAHRVAESFAGDTVFIDLSATTEADHVLPAIAQGLGIRESASRTPQDALRAALQTRTVLLVLDNFEQVIDAAPIVADLVARSENATVLTTSREALRVRGEEVLTLDPLDVPTEEQFTDIEMLSQSASISLFLHIARVVKPGFELTEDNARAISEICRRLEGLPLAIKLAASRVRYFPPDVLLGRLDARLPLLTGGSRDLPARHQTLRDTIAWSHDLLNADEQALFRRIGAFPGGATLAALDTYAKVAGGLNLDLLDGLASLADKNLVREHIGANDVLRFSMLETIREYAGEMATQIGELETQHKAMVTAMLEFVRSGNGGLPAWVLGPENLREGDDELVNIRAAFNLATDQGDAESCAVLFTEMHGYFQIRGFYREAINLGRKVLELADANPIPDVLRGRTLTNLSYFLTTVTDPVEGERLAQEGLALARRSESGNLDLIGALIGPITALMDQGRYAEALRYAEEADDLAAKLANEPIRGLTRYFLGSIAGLIDDRERAIAHLKEGISHNKGNEIGIYAGSELAGVYLRQGEVSDAALVLRKVLRWWQEAGSNANGRPFDKVALLAVASHHPEIGAKLFAANAAQHALYGTRERDDRWTTAALDAVRTQLGPEAFESASQAGHALGLEEATAVALELIDSIEQGSAVESHAR